MEATSLSRQMIAGFALSMIACCRPTGQSRSIGTNAAPDRNMAYMASMRWAERGMTSALGQFDRSSPTWHWPLGWITLRRRMDHVLYSPDLHCAAARVIPAGPSDHFPVEAVFTRAVAKG